MACESFYLWLRQFALLLWKNTIIQIRRPIGTLLELILPCTFVIVLIIIRYQLFAPLNFCAITTPTIPLQVSSFDVFYAPNDAQVNSIISRAELVLSGGGTAAVNFTGYSSEADLLSAIEQYRSTNDIHSNLTFAGVVFPSNLSPSSTDIVVTIRQKHEVPNSTSWETDTLSTGDRILVPPANISNYLTQGFVQLQNALSFGITEWKLNGSGVSALALPTVVMRALPFPKYSIEYFLSRTIVFLPILLVVGYIYSAGVFTQELVLEKENRLKESMKMMGLKSSANYCSWIFKQFFFLMISALALAFLIKFGIFSKSDFFIILFLMIIYVISLIAFAFFVSSLFSSAKLALFGAIILWFVLILPYLPLALDFSSLSLGVAVGLCLFSNTCFGFAMNFLGSHEGTGEGVNWVNAVEPISSQNQLHLGFVFGMMLLDIVVFFVFAWYKQAVFPGKYGVPKPFYFPFLPSYWLGRPLRKKSASLSAPEHERSKFMLSNFEAEPEDASCGITIKNLTKIYKGLFRKQKVAVNDLSLNMYEGQITALLGHNGAGKTTTMSVLTGLYTPTSGDAVINGYSILTDIDEIRKNLGLCPQHNVLFERLTVKEHLMLFGMLKGSKYKKLKEEIKEYLSDLHLEDKIDVPVSDLSGGMKRKLSVAIALIAGSKFVVLDEPTSGMDPYARRAIWALLAKHKKGRTIMLTTHHMDEADTLGDRIAIMAEGKLLTSGSSLFLKSRFGVGYHLTMVKGRDASSERICEVVTSTIDGAEKVEDVAGELSFVLPSHLTDQYPELFDKLEADKEALGITSYGVAATSMEDVFLRIMKAVDEGHFDEEILKPPPKRNIFRRKLSKRLSQCSQRISQASEEGLIGSVVLLNQQDGQTLTITFGNPDVPRAEIVQTQDPNQPKVKNGSQNGTENRIQIKTQDGNQNGNQNEQDEVCGNKETQSHDTDIDYLKDIDLNTGGRLWIQQFWAMLVKRALNTMRNAGNVLSQLVLPALLCLGALIYIKTSPDPNAQDVAITLTHPLTSSVNNIVMEYGDFRVSPTDDVFSTLDASLLQVSSFRNITEGVNRIRQEVVTHNDSALCCDYNQQLLDNYCLSINSSVYFNNLSSCSSNANFAFANCLDCLRDSSSCTLTPPTPMTPPLTGPVSDINTYITEYMLRNVPFAEFVQNHQLAVVHDDLPFGSLFTVWYNSRYLHKAPAALSTFHNLYLNHLLQVNSIQGQTTVNFINQPLPRIENGIGDRIDTDFTGFTLGFFLTLPVMFLLGGFILSPVEESSSKSKHLQFVSGVRVSSYWMANFMWDITIIIVNIAFVSVMAAAFQIREFTGANFLAFFLLLVLVCWVGLPLMYCLSFLFKSSLLAFSASVMVLYFLAVGLVAVKNAVANVDSTTADIIHYISLTIPSYSFEAGIQTIYSNENRRQICPLNPVSCVSTEGNTLRFTDNIFELNSLGVSLNLIVLAAEGILMWILTFFIINSFFCKEGRWLTLRRQQKNVTEHRRRNATRRQRSYRKREDDDVERERSRVDDMRYLEDMEKDPLTIADLSKWYEHFLHKLGLRKFLSKRKFAVNHLSVGIHKSECFGLLGVNGAGKTTTFKILTGDLNPTSGTAFIAGEDIRKNIKGAQQHLGYCPQFDALLERMTGEELLTMFCRLRGIPEKKIPHILKMELGRIGLEKFAKKQCGTYSGGNMRKLSVALALTGGPPILLMDEPTSGMDPKSRRKVWEVLNSAVSQGRSVVLCSHSMEECEALCTRLAIMVNGEFKSLGSVQHLKNKFGSGYTLSIKAMRSPLGPDGTTVYRTNVPTLGDLGPSLSQRSFTQSRIDERVFNSVFPGVTVLEEHDGYATINLPSNSLSWSEIFRKLEEHKEYLGIEDYSVSQTTLEQVFLDVAKYQHGIPEDQPA